MNLDRVVAGVGIAVALILAQRLPDFVASATAQHARNLPESRLLGTAGGAWQPFLELPPERELQRAGLLPEPWLALRYEQLAQRWLAAGRTNDARRAIWAAIRREHMRAAVDESYDPWELLVRVEQAAGRDQAAIEALELLSDLSPARVARSLAALGFDSTVSTFLAARAAQRGMLPRLPPATLATLAAAWPPALKARWRVAIHDRPWDLSAAAFHLATSPYFEAREPIRQGETLLLAWSTAIEAEIRLDRSIGEIELGLEGVSILGIPPLLAVELDGGPPWPIAVDEDRQLLPVAWSAGRHRIRIEYLNDANLTDRRGERADRSVRFLGLRYGVGAGAPAAGSAAAGAEVPVPGFSASMSSRTITSSRIRLSAAPG